MSAAPLPNLVIDPQRLWDDLMETAKIGGNAKGGICRLTLSDEDKEVRLWFTRACEAIGCTVTVDDCGNMFARRPGRKNDLPPICMGSHLDTQPTGGKFDGVLGVLAALEVMRTLQQAGYETYAPLEIVNWTNEEGSRFAPAMLASGVFAGALAKDFAYSRVDGDGNSFVSELERIGFKGAEPVGQHKIGAMFELHIEQGPILEAENKMIGVVTGVQGVRWYEVNVHGQSAHTGATPMTLRRDALVGAARMVDAINAIALANLPNACASVGMLNVEPNSRNVVPGDVFFTIDLRHPQDAILDKMEKELRAALPRVLEPLGLAFEEKCIWQNPAVKFDEELIACVRKGAEKAGYTTRDLVSGAGHDAAYIARIAPTTMIFVPSAGGVSHNESESTSFAECGAGAQVLLEAVLAYDQRTSPSAQAISSQVGQAP
jgi:beta-ureidopropionase / N-carbamoyl-L-amino-acid hydrolase